MYKHGNLLKNTPKQNKTHIIFTRGYHVLVEAVRKMGVVIKILNRYKNLNQVQISQGDDLIHLYTLNKLRM